MQKAQVRRINGRDMELGKGTGMRGRETSVQQGTENIEEENERKEGIVEKNVPLP